eukprot:8333993-Ditylum_brightwellii.AAC.1
MSNLLCVQKSPFFGWYYSWLKLNDISEPHQDIDNGMRQSGTIKVVWNHPNSAQHGGIHGLSANIVPDK